MTTTTTHKLDLPIDGNNFGAFALYSDTADIGRKSNIRALRKLPLVSKIAQTWAQQLNTRTWGQNHAQGWSSHIWGTTERAYHREKYSKSGEEIHQWAKQLTSDDILRSLASMSEDREGLTKYFAVGNSDRYNSKWSTFGEVAPNYIQTLRIDIDAYFLTQTLASEAYSAVAEVANALSLPFALFATGNRGVQVIFRLPRQITTAVAVVILDAVKQSLKSRLEQMKIDCDNLRGLMRLPLMRHAKSHELGLFLGPDGNRLPIEEQIATAMTCFALSAEKCPILDFAESLVEGLCPNTIPNKETLASMVNQIGTECGLFAPVRSSSTKEVTNVVERGAEPVQVNQSAKLLAICNRPVEPGQILDYLTRGWGAWAHQTIYGDDAELRLTDKLMALPGADEHRLDQIKYHIANCVTFSESERKEYNRKLPLEINPADQKAAGGFARRLKINKQAKGNAMKIKCAELHIMRHTRRKNLSAGDMHRVCKLLFGGEAPSISSVKRAIYSEYWQTT